MFQAGIQRVIYFDQIALNSAKKTLLLRWIFNVIDITKEAFQSVSFINLKHQVLQELCSLVKIYIINNTLFRAQNSGNCISKLLILKFSWDSMPPDPLVEKGPSAPFLTAAACFSRLYKNLLKLLPLDASRVLHQGKQSVPNYLCRRKKELLIFLKGYSYQLSRANGEHINHREKNEMMNEIILGNRGKIRSVILKLEEQNKTVFQIFLALRRLERVSYYCSAC